MSNNELDSCVCESALLPDNVFLLWTDRQKEREREKQAATGRGRGEKPLHCTQESTCSALWECLDISSNGSAWEKKEKSSSMLWLQPAGAKGLAPIWHKQTHTAQYMHTYSIRTGICYTYTHSNADNCIVINDCSCTQIHSHAQCNMQVIFDLSVCTPF